MTDKDLNDVRYSGRRLRLWFAIQAEAFGISIEELTRELGYEKPAMVKMLMNGKAKFPWTLVPKLSKIFLTDPAIIVALYVDQEADESVRESVFEASCRIVAEWEMPLLNAARSIYIDDPNSIWTTTPDHEVNRYM